MLDLSFYSKKSGMGQKAWHKHCLLNRVRNTSFLSTGVFLTVLVQYWQNTDFKKGLYHYNGKIHSFPMYNTWGFIWSLHFISKIFQTQIPINWLRSRLGPKILKMSPELTCSLKIFDHRLKNEPWAGPLVNILCSAGTATLGSVSKIGGVKNITLLIQFVKNWHWISLSSNHLRRFNLELFTWQTLAKGTSQNIFLGLCPKHPPTP